MELFLRNVPDQFSEKHLTSSFTPLLKACSINSFHCQKRGKKFAVLTVLDEGKAQRFLDRHGDLGGARVPSMPIRLAGRFIGITRSRNNPPDKLILDHLREKELEQKQRARLPPTKTAAPIQKTFAATAMSCGFWDYVGEEAVFVTHLDLRRSGTVSFKRAHLKLLLGSGDITPSTHHVDWDYASMVGPIYLSGGQAPHMTFTVCQAPRLFDTSSLRLLELLSMRPGAAPDLTRATRLGRDDIGVTATCFVYRIMLQQSSDVPRIQALKVERQIPELNVHPTRTIRFKTPHQAQLDSFLHLLTLLQWPYQLKYQTQMLVWNGVLPAWKVSKFLVAIRQLYEKKGLDRTVDVLRKFSKNVAYAGPGAEARELTVLSLRDLLSSADEAQDTGIYRRTKSRVSSNMAWIHRATVTPVGTYLSGPNQESMNRVLRRYRANTDQFLRVEICEESGDTMTFDRHASLDEVYQKRFRGVLKDGIEIGGQRFDFLGYSHSSLRAHICWFVAPFTSDEGESLDATSIIPLLGDFSSIRSPAKCAARIGQTMSHTFTSIAIDPQRVRVIDDIKTNVRGQERIFSDGVGTLSPAFLREICHEYAISAAVKPTVFQVRVAGAKGMISLDSTMTDCDLRLRRSMLKFDALDSWNVEICGSGMRPLPCFLNRQFIKILEDLGVPLSVFSGLQQEEVDRLRRAGATPLAAAAFLEKLNMPSSIRLPWLVRELNRLGCRFSDDDFLRRAVELAFLVRLRDLKYRARILVADGMTLYGIMDETGILQEGEIYCPIVKEDGHRHVLVQRDVVITRAPALHPGDVQLVDAVDVPVGSPLEHLHNCVVFSQHGVRDLPSKLSGGDLDGDLYHIIHDKRLRPTRIHVPADYRRVKELLLDRAVRKDDIIDFFLTFMQQDQLGRIATVHQQIADQKEEGTMHPDCLTLAELHSTAVDFSKSGRPADISRIPKYPPLRPDFMCPGPGVNVAEDISLLETATNVQGNDDDDDGPQIHYYKTKKVLGHLYRAIDERTFLGELKQSMRTSRPKDGDIMQLVWAHVQREAAAFQWKHHVETAQEIKDLYEANLVDLMYQYSARPSAAALNEVEIFVGHVIGKENQRVGKRQREASQNMQDEYDRLVVSITAEIVNEDGQRDESLERSIACLSLWEQHGSFKPQTGKETQLQSFRWIAATVCLQELNRFRKEFKLARVPASS